MFIANKAKAIEFLGKCHDCKDESQVLATWTEDGIAISGGAVYKPFAEKFFIKCDECFQQEPILKDFQDCQIFTRTVGFYAATENMNKGKQAVEAMRKNFFLDAKDF